IRHSEDLASQRGRFDDLKLTIAGEADARKIGQFLLTKNIHKLYSSPMVRTAESAELISAIINQPVVTNNLLRDRYLGQAQGLTYQQVQMKFSSVLSQSTFGIDFKFPDGESNGDLYDRAVEFAKEILETTVGTTEQIAIISHPLMLNYIMYYLMGIGFQGKLIYKFEYGMCAIVSKDRNALTFQVEYFGELG
ncbi:MAG: histidine phosphatase family protein, partial [Candidatus Heimdallarchaeota archaeon]|nr:histidine phosphatase family protein [Candidatus Heimdallarchaeota archaeon]